MGRSGTSLSIRVEHVGYSKEMLEMHGLQIILTYTGRSTINGLYSFLNKYYVMSGLFSGLTCWL